MITTIVIFTVHSSGVKLEILHSSGVELETPLGGGVYKIIIFVLYVEAVEYIVNAKHF